MGTKLIIKDDTRVVIESSGCKRRLYRAYCDLCKSDRGYQRIHRAEKPFCKVCASKLEHTGKLVSLATRNKQSSVRKLMLSLFPEKHGFLNRPHSDETKLKLSNLQKKHCKKFGNQFITGKSKGKHSKSTITLLSHKNSGKSPKWKGRIFQYKGCTGTFKMRSSYELVYANWMDNQNIQWEYEPQFRLSDGRLFSPDFRLSNGDIIEIKGYWTKKGQEKWDLFCSDYPNLNKKVLMKADLQKLGII